MASVDTILGAAVNAVRDSGMLEASALMATVSAIGSAGTVDVVRGADTFPRVRLLSGCATPAVGDSVEILRTAAGWVCLGSLVTNATAWQTPSLIGNWSAYGGDYAPPRYRRVGRRVELNGLVKTSAAISVDNIFVLPAGFRPVYNHPIITVAQGNATQQLNVYNDGNVRAMNLTVGWSGFITFCASFPLD